MAKQLHVSPLGEALWAKILGEPQGYDNDPKAWTVSLLLDPSDPATIEFVEKLEAAFEEHHGKGAKVANHGWPFAEETIKDEKGRAVPTGKLKFNFKRKELWPSGEPMSPPIVVDSKKNLWPQEQLIGNGSKIKVAFSTYPWTGRSGGGKGMSLDLHQVQVVDLVSYNKGGDVDVFAEEDGYVVETPAAQTEFEREPSFADKLKARAAEVAAEAPEVLAQPAEEIPF